MVYSQWSLILGVAIIGTDWPGNTRIGCTVPAITPLPLRTTSTAMVYRPDGLRAMVLGVMLFTVTPHPAVSNGSSARNKNDFIVRIDSSPLLTVLVMDKFWAREY